MPPAPLGWYCHKSYIVDKEESFLSQEIYSFHRKSILVTSQGDESLKFFSGNIPKYPMPQRETCLQFDGRLILKVVFIFKVIL